MTKARPITREGMKNPNLTLAEKRQRKNQREQRRVLLQEQHRQERRLLVAHPEIETLEEAKQRDALWELRTQDPYTPSAHFFLLSESRVLQECSSYALAIEACRSTLLDDRVMPTVTEHSSGLFTYSARDIDDRIHWRTIEFGTKEVILSYGWSEKLHEWLSLPDNEKVTSFLSAGDAFDQLATAKQNGDS